MHKMSRDLRMLMMALLLCLVADAALSSRFKKPQREVIENSEEARELGRRCFKCVGDDRTLDPCCYDLFCAPKSATDIKCDMSWERAADKLRGCGMEKVRCIRNDTIEPHASPGCD